MTMARLARQPSRERRNDGGPEKNGGGRAERSGPEGCRGESTGARADADIGAAVPVGGKIFFTLYLCPTLLVDTLALPVTAFGTPKRPAGGFVIGCRWAKER